MTDLQATPASAWKRAADNTQTVTLPSGNTAVLKKELRMKALVRAGTLEKQHLDVMLQIAGNAIEDQTGALELQDVLVTEAFVSPRVVLTHEELSTTANAVLIDDLSDEDLDYVVAFVFGAIGDDATFPPESGGADSGADSGTVEQKPKRATRSRARKPVGVPS